jgi:hypothetical protein
MIESRDFVRLWRSASPVPASLLARSDEVIE